MIFVVVLRLDTQHCFRYGFAVRGVLAVYRGSRYVSQNVVGVFNFREPCCALLFWVRLKKVQQSFLCHATLPSCGQSTRAVHVFFVKSLGGQVVSCRLTVTGPDQRELEHLLKRPDPTQPDP